MTDDERVRIVAAQLSRNRQIPGHVYDDLVQAGWIGVLQAKKAFDPNRGGWPTYADRRIRGAMLDWLRLEGNIPRKRFAKWKRERPDDCFLIRLPFKLPRKGWERLTADAKDPVDTIHRSEIHQVVQQAIGKLKPIHRLVIIELYINGKSRSSVAAIIGRVESRVSQLVTAAKEKMRKTINWESRYVGAPSAASSPKRNSSLGS